MGLSVVLCLTLFLVCGAYAQSNRLPVPLSSIYVFNEEEEQPNGTILTRGLPTSRIMAFDAEKDPIEYIIPVNSINSQLFGINATSGELYFQRALDREALPNSLELVVEISDGQFHGAGVFNPRIEVQIVLSDINDEEPEFSNLGSTIRVPEDMDINSTLYTAIATDADVAGNALVSYFLEAVGLINGGGETCYNVNITSPSLCNVFTVGISTGVITLKRKLNYDLPSGEQLYIVSVRAQDSGEVPLSSVEELRISVTDVNDLDPIFTRNVYAIDVHENLTFGDTVIQVSASDQDVGVNDDVLYSILSGNSVLNGSESFAINATTGVIYVNTTMLDRETHQQYTLFVRATELNDADRTVDARVIITILDLNDHAPVFEQSTYSANVSESLDVGDMVVIVTALDRDTGVHAEFEFTLVNAVNSSLPLPFVIEHDVDSGEGSVVVDTTLDFEELESYSFLVYATEVIGNRSMSGVTMVTVYVINENDNTPTFDNMTYEASVPENASPGAFVEIVRARDDDKGDFGVVKYSIVSGPGAGDFNITMDTGRVETDMRLDYENASSYTLQIQAMDQGISNATRRSGEATLLVTVINLNDNPPQFVNRETRPQVMVTEEQAPNVIYTFEVTDPDGTLNPLTIEIDEGNDEGAFAIDGLNLVTTRMLDYDNTTTNQSFTLTVTVNDTTHEDTIIVDIVVIDLNDNNPVFENATYQFAVSEGEAAGALVGVVTAIDIDSGTFGQVAYALAGPGENSFLINSSTGVIVTVVELDRETRPMPFELVVTATDLDGNSVDRNRGDAQVIINTLDLNDNSPMFEDNSYSFSVAENTDVLDPNVFVVLATDRDDGTNSEITYNITGGNQDNVFVIDPVTGVLGRDTLLYLDREREDEYTLTVTASDGGNPSNPTPVSVTITLEDENDIVPTFDLPQFSTTIREDIEAATTVIQLIALDGDSEENGQLTYSITSVSGPSSGVNAPSGSFVIDEGSGLVRTSGSFDREAFEGPYTVMVLVRDGGFPISHASSTNLLVFISDANDNRPLFQQDQYTNILSENRPAGELVVTVTASDNDMPGSNNSAITYAITAVLGGDLTDFSINSTSGEVTTAIMLDYEAVQSYTITVKASDAGVPPSSSFALIVLTVEDDNDQLPTFTMTSYTFQVPEDTPINSRFEMISASDGDTPPNARIVYSSTLVSPLRIDPSTGELILTSSLDFERTDLYDFNVTATNDAGSVVFTSTSSVRINVLDVNDNAPVYGQVDYSVEINEGDYATSPEILSVNLVATDSDSGVFGNVSFELLLPAQDSALWAVRTTENGRGQLVAIGNLDRETVSNYMVPISARDGGNPAATATTIVRVTVLDVNDNRPQLNRASYNASVIEMSAIGQVIARVTAVDSDEGFNGEVILSLSDTSDFIIDPDTGEIFTVTEFNYETVMSFTLDVIATDNATRASDVLESTAPLYITIIDINDNAPVFVNPVPNSATAFEDDSIGRTLATFHTTDADSGSNEEMIFTLTGDEGDFTIDNDGVLSIARSLDRETTEMYNIIVQVFDRGQPQMSAETALTITVEDVNDQAPVFEQDFYGFTIDESPFAGVTVGTVVAMDTDTAGFNGIVYELVGGDVSFFLVDGKGDITSSRPLDFESQSTYSLRVRAVEDINPPRLGFEDFTTVIITLRDINDSPPQFTRSTYIFSVSEGTPIGTPVGTVVATDNDGGDSGRVSYSFGNVQPFIRTFFTIGASDGLISLASVLNFDNGVRYDFTVLAIDMGSPSLSSTPASVSVTVLNVNENAPVFDRSSYVGSVGENTPLGSPVATVNATVQDGSTIQYTINAGDPSQRFTILSSGDIITRASLDREEQDRYILTIQALIPGNPPRPSYTQVDVTVTDSNDQTPVFQAPISFTLSEQSGVGALVGVLAASDGDIGTNAEFSFSSSASAPFTVQTNGNIVVADAAAVNFETTPLYTFVVMVTDRGGRSSTASVTITVTNANDNAPVFRSSSYTTTVLENSAAGVSVVTVTATDADGDTPAYSILSGDPSSRFRMNSVSGLIETTANTIDREGANQQVFTLRVQADDQQTPRMTSVVTVTINVLDVNDNAPVCDQSPLTIMDVVEDNSNSVRLGVLMATDIDLGVNAAVLFSVFSGDFEELFSINSAGELFAAPGLDFETTTSYLLGVAATDQSLDPRDRQTTICTVDIQLVDANDNAPVFSNSLYESTIIENATMGTVVTMVSAEDIDSDQNAEVFYLFQSPIREFSVDATSGVVTVSGSLDAETQPLYNLVLEARDRGSPTRIGQTTLVVRILNIDDNAPRFDSSFFTVMVREDQQMNSDVVSLQANDPDDSSTLTYSIESGNNGLYFRINSNTGLIQTARSLDRETVSVFSLVVAARDSDENIGTTTLQIRLIDVNDEAPVFLQSSYYARVPENSPTGTQVLPILNGSTIRIEAFDADEPNTQNSRVLYSLRGVSADLFNIDFNTGIVTVAPGATLDAEAQGMLAVTVVASDSVIAPNTRSSTVELLVEVLDLNDESPMFTQPFGYAIPVSEGSTVPSVITTGVKANDPDGGVGGIVRYSITGATPLVAMQWFTIDMVTGDITLMQGLDRESNEILTLVVTATDLGQPALMSQVTVQLTISDVNDNAPRFSQGVYTAEVPEFLAVGASALKVFANDPDVGSNGEVVYAVSTNNRFTIHPDSGEITSTGPLDHETQDRFTFIVWARDNGSLVMSSSAQVIIIVQDFNDEPPTFDLPLYAVDVCHMNGIAGTPLVKPVAVDRDSGINAQINYIILGDVSSLFVVSAHGLISLARDVNDQDVGGTFIVTLTATDNGAVPLSDSTQVQLRVVNCSMTEFYFQQPYNFLSINEGSNNFIGATTNARIILGEGMATSPAAVFSPNYANNPFNLIPSTNVLLSLLTPMELATIGVGQDGGLDREVRAYYTVILKATHITNPDLVSYASVTVRVLDLNDNSPLFVAGHYAFNVFENTTTPVAVGTVTANDIDDDVNSVIVYSILQSGLPFAIEGSSGFITTTTELDRESVDSYRFTVLATDGGTTSRSGITVVDISVVDINDCNPTFTQDVYAVNVSENIPVATSIAMVTALDCDLGENGRLRYTIISGPSVFSLDAESGVIRTLTLLDFESTQSYSLVVRATDNGSPVRIGVATVNIVVQDFNDCPPVFVNLPPSGSVSIAEGVSKGTVLETFQVSDCDSGDNGVNGTRFTIIAGNDDNSFSLNSMSGVLVTTVTLDRETRANYLLSVQAQDSAGINSLSSVTQLTVTVDDRNDNRPMFSADLIRRTLSESEEVGPVFTFTATDSDEGTNSAVLYSIMDEFGMFDIEESSGVISLVTTLDRETTPVYNLTVVARDRGSSPLSSNLYIEVEVRDVNDNAPTIHNITSGVTTTTVPEGTVVGTQVFVVEATDPDQGQNGDVTYSLQDTFPNRPFEISSAGGVISVSGDLDYESQNVYTLVVIATDNGSPQRQSSVTTLTINIQDNNDNIPEFTLAMYEGLQEEGVAVGSPIVTVVATDADQTGTTNAEVLFSLIGGAVNYFTITPGSTPNTGVISNNIVLDRENQSLFTLTVLANNSRSHTPLSATVTVTISVTDSNDERPIFDTPTYNASLSELTSSGSLINVNVSATDNDAPGTPNSDLVYSLARQTNNPFSVDPNSGEVILQNSLDFETTTSYDLVLVVEDKGSPTLSSQARLFITVLDRNDAMPSFTAPSYSATVSERETVFPHRVLNLAYDDADTLSEYRQSTISILTVQPDMPGLFSVMTDTITGSTGLTGSLVINRAVDFEQEQSFTVTLGVENNAMGSGPLCLGRTQCVFNQSVVVEITIGDENDNLPVFTKAFYSGEVSSTAATGTSVLSVLANDDDVGPATGNVVYSLVSSGTLPFRIQEVTGTVLTRGLLTDIPSGSEFTLIVMAFDNNRAVPFNSAQTTVKVVVLDDFDRIAFDFNSQVGCVISNEQMFADILSDITGYTIVIESYVEYATADNSLFIIHALDGNQDIVDFAQFTDRIRSREAEIFQQFGVCNLTRIISFAEAEEPYEYPPLVDTQTIVILVLCLLLIVGSAVLLVMALTQRYVALNDARHKLLADVFYGGSPGSGSVVDNVNPDNYQMEVLEKPVNRQNPMFVQPYDDWAGVDTSGVESVEGASTMNRDNPLYESQEIRMEMFADIQSDEDEADDAELLAQAIADDESDDDDDDNAVTAI